MNRVKRLAEMLAVAGVQQNIPGRDVLSVVEREIRSAYLQKFKGNKTRAGKSLGVHRNTLQRYEQKERACSSAA